MSQKVLLPEIDFGQPEAELDRSAIKVAFYEGENWNKITSHLRTPFVVGRKGSGKSAIVTRLEIEAEEKEGVSFLRIVPADFRHVEIRSLLARLVNKEATWQYIYSKVWEGIILGQLVQYLMGSDGKDNNFRLSNDLVRAIGEFQTKCGFYVASLGDALSEVIVKYVTDSSKKTDELSLVALRKMLEPYNWSSLVHEIQKELTSNNDIPNNIVVAIDGLDEHWDNTEPSLFFLAQLLAVTKHYTSAFSPAVKFVICLRDNIFRSLVDTKSIEYDKIESLIINLEWNSRSLFELVSMRVVPNRKADTAIATLKELLPESIDGDSIDDYLGHHILNRPRDYINVFRMLQAKCGSRSRAGEGDVRDTIAKYCANRLVDLENEFGFTYPGISKCITGMGQLDDVFEKDDLLSNLSALCKDASFRQEAPELVTHYGDPLVLSRILLSIGVIGYYDPVQHALRFVHEFSESRVGALWDGHQQYGVHPVYKSRAASRLPRIISAPDTSDSPAIVSHPVDYLASKDNHRDLESIEEKKDKIIQDLIAELGSIDKGKGHFRRWEKWVANTMEICFGADLINMDDQIRTVQGDKRFELIFDINSDEAPWGEIKGKWGTHRALIECKNTEDPSDSDFSKLERDMTSLDLNVVFMAYRGDKREPSGKFLQHQRTRYINSKKEHAIIALSEKFLFQCLKKKTSEKCRDNLNKLWRDHVTRWLVS